ncbi:hypothetical protein V7V80_26015 [Pseudomonas kermanshahensis]|uniref:MBL fold metallo-hydrolase n=1 Tax=Pseudomonas kermanshahensis TaxID=2745482 RepID=A0ABU8RE19_9PSED
MPTPPVFSSIRQLPIGQGGFLVGEVTDGRSEAFTYAFDCGSINREHFEQGLSLCSYDKIDVLFVSHLDVDHISGIEALAAQVQINTVILPCLDALHLTLIALESISAGGLRLSVRTFLQDPAGWFADRGVKQILHIPRGDSATEAEQFDPDTSGRDDIVSGSEADGLRGPYTIRSKGAGPSKSVRAGAAQERTLGEETSITADIGWVGGSPCWLLVPYVHPFPEADIAAFRTLAGKLLPANFSDRAIASKVFTNKLLKILADEDDRKTLKRCYRVLSGDHNRISLSLYAGPHPSCKRKKIISRTDENYFWPLMRSRHHLVVPRGGSQENREGAWLCTGDADLNTKETRTQWLRRYKQLIQRVEVFVLPHHGSNNSIHDEVIDRLRDVVMVACAATGRAKHPHPLLIGRLRAAGSSVWQVSEDPESTYAMHVRFDG